MFILIKRLFAVAKKAILVGAVFSFILIFFSYFINQNRPRIDEKKFLQMQQKQLYSVLTDKKYNSTKISKIAMLGYRSMTCIFIGELCTDTPPKDNSYFQSSLLGRTVSFIALPYQYPPASGTYWAMNVLQNAGMVPTSYAAEGIGFASIKPLMNLWKIFRDVSYLLVVLILVSVGFMIMFRAKVNPQTVISIENALPKIVVALLLITFSFAIAGFLIDAMYLLIGLIVSILSNNNTYYDAAKYQNTFLQANFGTLWEFIIPYQMQGFDGFFPRFVYVGDALASLLPNEINSWAHGLSIGAFLFLLFPTLGNIFSNTLAIPKALNNFNIFGNGIGQLTEPIFAIALNTLLLYVLIALSFHALGFILGIVVFLAIFGMLVNIFFMLLRAYIQITVTIILAPIILLFEALPGKSVFTFWIKGLVAELLTFPIVIMLILVGKVMLTTMSYPGDFWNPPFLFQLNTGAFGVIFGMGLILITPDIVKFVKDGIGAKPLPFNIGIGTFLGGAGSVVGGGMGVLQQFSTISMGLNGISGITDRFKSVVEAKKDTKTAIDATSPVAPLASGTVPGQEK